MSDTRAAMKEFRFLEEKRARGILSSAEEARWGELKRLLATQGVPAQESATAMDPAQQQPQGYYGADGQWYAYPADYSQSGYAAQGYDPHQGYAQQPQGYYGADGQWYAYPAQGGYDPHQG